MTIPVKHLQFYKIQDAEPKHLMVFQLFEWNVIEN